MIKKTAFVMALAVVVVVVDRKAEIQFRLSIMNSIMDISLF